MYALLLNSVDTCGQQKIHIRVTFMDSVHIHIQFTFQGGY